MKKFLQTPFIIRLLHWEYWPFHLVYAVVYPYWLWLSIKARSFFFFSAANPTIKNGGFLMESKQEIYDLLPEGLYPKTIFVKCGTTRKEVRKQVLQSNLRFPLIAKPDIGLRGIGVKKIHGWLDLDHYALLSNVNFLVQECVSFENEAGIFYCRFPNEEKGFVSGIVLKEFVQVEGDGISTILQLVRKNKRHILQLDQIVEQHFVEMNKVLPRGTKRILVPYGNHSRGAKFIDGSHMIDKELTQTIDSICQHIDGFYYGRLDIRFHSWEDLRQGKNFSIIELNGAGSEPTHIYDPKHSIFFAWKEIIRHINILYKISQQNKKRQPFMSFKDGLKMIRENASHLRLLNSSELRA
jgi:hypothetical protein